MFRSFAWHVNQNSKGFCGAKISDQGSLIWAYSCCWTDEKNPVCFCWKLNEAKAKNMMEVNFV